MADFDAIVLAAGVSSRMGAKNKLLLDWQGAPLVAHVVRCYVNALKGEVAVVTGFEADQIKDALKGLPVTLIHNASFETGQQSSVVTALRRTSTTAATLLGLGDQPLLEPDDLRWLMSVHQTHDPKKITVPNRNGIRGNPIVIPAGLRSRMLQNPHAPGCRRFTRENPELISNVESERPGFFTDIDTPGDYALLKASDGGIHETAS